MGIRKACGDYCQAPASMNAIAIPRYRTVTEQPGQAASRAQLEMMAARYSWARRFALGRDVLEAACGAGTGLGMLAEVARSVEAGDIDDANLASARRTYALQPKVHVQPLNAMELPFGDACFDVVLLFEAIYYLHGARAFFEEARRVLRPGGHLLIATVNREWKGFNPSPFHTRYLAAAELREGLEASGFAVELHAGFPERPSLLSEATGLVRRAAVALHLVPRTMAGKTFLKRMFYGRLEPIPPRLDLRHGLEERFQPLHGKTDLTRYRVLYAAARKNFAGEIL